MGTLTTYCIYCGQEIDVDMDDCEARGEDCDGCEGCELDRHEALEEAQCGRCYHMHHPSLSAWERNQ